MAASQDAELERIAGEYRKAFEEVQRLLSGLELGTVPPYVFAIDKFDVKEFAGFDQGLAKAEQVRRQWRAALHAMAELAALQDDGATPEPPTVLDTFDPDDPQSSVSEAIAADKAGMANLDRFISVVQYARSVGCMYVDGGFEPVIKGSSR